MIYCASRGRASSAARLVAQLQGFGLGNVDGIGDEGGVLAGSSAIEADQVVTDRCRHADEGQAGLTRRRVWRRRYSPVLAKPMGDADAQRDLQPAVERQHHVHRLETLMLTTSNFCRGSTCRFATWRPGECP